MTTQTCNTTAVRSTATHRAANRPKMSRGPGAHHENLTGPLADAMRAAPVFTEAEERAATQAVTDAHLAAWTATLGATHRPTRRALLLLTALERVGGDDGHGRTILARWPADAEAQGLLESLAREDVPRVVSVLRALDPEQSVLRACQAVALDDLDDARTSARSSMGTCLRAQEARRALLAAQVTLGRAEDKMVRHNLRMGLAIARPYASQMPLMDLLQEASVGLLSAVRRFDPSRGWRFSTFAAWWVRHQCSRTCANEARVIRLPVGLQEKARKMQSTEDRMTAQALGVTPTLADLADALGWEQDAVIALRLVTAPSVSMDAPLAHHARTFSTVINSDDTPNIADILPSTLPRVDDLLADAQDAAEAARLLSTLPPLAADVVRCVIDDHPMTFVEVDDALGLPRGRTSSASKIYRRAIADMRVAAVQMSL